MGIEVDLIGSVVLSESGNHRIRRIQAGSGLLLAVAGGGTAGFNGDGNPLVSTLFDQPQGLWSDGSGLLYVADAGNGGIRRFRLPN